MKIETTPMDDVWLGVMTVALVVLVMRTISTLEKMSKKVDALVNHIGSEVGSASSKLSSEASCMIKSIERNAFGYKEHLLQDLQNVELQCYRSRHGIAFGFGPKTMKKKASKSSSLLSRNNHHALRALSSPENAHEQQQEQEQEHHHSTVALCKCVEKVLKFNKWPLVSSLTKKHKQEHQQQVVSAKA